MYLPIDPVHPLMGEAQYWIGHCCKLLKQAGTHTHTLVHGQFLADFTLKLSVGMHSP